MSLTSHQRDLSRVNITPEMIQEALRPPGDFGLSSSADHADEIGTTWSLGPIIETRDSSLRDRANRIALIRYLESVPELADDWTITGASHWAVGWVDHLTYRVVDSDGSPSRMMRELIVWTNALESYSVADESLLSEMESEAESRNLRDILRDVRRSVVVQSPDLETRLDKADDDALYTLMWRNQIYGESDGEGWRRNQIYGESDGEGWRRYNKSEIGRLVDVLWGMVSREVRRAARKARRAARKARRGWA